MTQVLASFPASIILPLIGSDCAARFTHLKWKAKLNGHRLLTFKASPVCVRCGIQGTIFRLELPVNHASPHLNLYAVVNGKFILMTRDHICPVSKGGSNALGNAQTMCEKCNMKKGAEWDGRQGLQVQTQSQVPPQS